MFPFMKHSYFLRFGCSLNPNPWIPSPLVTNLWKMSNALWIALDTFLRADVFKTLVHFHLPKSKRQATLQDSTRINGKKEKVCSRTFLSGLE